MAPRITISPPGDQLSADGDPVSLHIAASDAHNLPLTYQLAGQPSGVNIDHHTGMITGTITGTDDRTGSTASLPIQVRYHGTAPLSFSATGLPPGLAIDRPTGRISGPIAPASLWRRYNVAGAVTDGPHRGGTALTWTVLPPGNQPPTMTHPGNQVRNEDDDIALPVQASDPDGDPLTDSATGLPSGLSIDPAGGRTVACASATCPPTSAGMRPRTSSSRSWPPTTTGSSRSPAMPAWPGAGTRRLQGDADRWRCLVGLSDGQAARLIREDGIDILVDLAGHSAGHRLLVFARSSRAPAE